MVRQEIVIEVHCDPERRRHTRLCTFNLPVNWHAEVVSGVPPSRVGGVQFFPAADANTREEAVRALVDELREEGHAGHVRILLEHAMAN